MNKNRIKLLLILYYFLNMHVTYGFIGNVFEHIVNSIIKQLLDLNQKIRKPSVRNTRFVLLTLTLNL